MASVVFLFWAALPTCIASHVRLNATAGASPRGLGDAAFGQGGCAEKLPLAEIQEMKSVSNPQRWVDAHNHYRRCHGAPELRWAPELLPTASAWVHQLLSHCKSGEDLEAWAAAGAAVGRPHDPNLFTTERPQQAENLDCRQYDSINDPEAASVEAWYREVSSCPKAGWQDGCGGVLNHYTALIWRDARRVACYVGLRGSMRVVSCRYAAESDDSSGCQVPNTVGPPGSCGCQLGCGEPNHIPQVPKLQRECPAAAGQGQHQAPAAPPAEHPVSGEGSTISPCQHSPACPPEWSTGESGGYFCHSTKGCRGATEGPFPVEACEAQCSIGHVKPGGNVVAKAAAPPAPPAVGAANGAAAGHGPSCVENACMVSCIQPASLQSCERCLKSEQCASGMFCCPFMKKCVSSSSQKCMTPIAFCQPPCMDSQPLSECKCNPKGSPDLFPQTWQKPTCDAGQTPVAVTTTPRPISPPAKLVFHGIKDVNQWNLMAKQIGGKMQGWKATRMCASIEAQTPSPQEQDKFVSAHGTFVLQFSDISPLSANTVNAAQLTGITPTFQTVDQAEMDQVCASQRLYSSQPPIKWMPSSLGPAEISGVVCWMCIAVAFLLRRRQRAVAEERAEDSEMGDTSSLLQ